MDHVSFSFEPRVAHLYMFESSWDGCCAREYLFVWIPEV